MKVNIYLHDRWYTKLTLHEALDAAAECYAIHGDTTTVITEASTNKVVNKFYIKGRDRWYTFEELIELSNYINIEVVDYC